MHFDIKAPADARAHRARTPGPDLLGSVTLAVRSDGSLTPYFYAPDADALGELLRLFATAAVVTGKGVTA